MLLTTAFAALLLPSFGATAKLSLNGNPFLFVPRAATAAVLGSIELSSPDASSSLPMQCDNAGEDHNRALCTSPQDAGLVTSICSDRPFLTRNLGGLHYEPVQFSGAGNTADPLTFDLLSPPQEDERANGAAAGSDAEQQRALEVLKAQLRAQAAQAEAAVAKRARDAEIMSLKQTLEMERQKAEQFALDSTSAQAEIEQLKNNIDRADGLVAEAADAKRAAEDEAARLVGALHAEREKADALANELAAARVQSEELAKQITAATAAQTEAEQTRARNAAAAAQALQAERQKSEALASELAAARAQSEELAKQVSTATAVQTEAEHERATEAAAPSRALQAERQKTRSTSALKESTSPGLREQANTRLESRSEPLTTGGLENSPAAQTTPERRAVPPASAGQPMFDVGVLLARTEGLIRQGDIIGARLLLEHALQGGSPQAAFALAETYDPHRLSAWRTLGIRADPARARELYVRAYDGGISQAKARADALR